MSKDDILLEAEMSMEKSVDYMVHEFAAVRTGKASPGLVENVDVHAYGSTMKLKQLALITTPEARLLVVQPFDAGTVQDIEKALKESKIGIMPAVDGKIIRLPIPELSEERRKELVRSLSKMAEEARVRVRANRRAALHEALLPRVFLFPSQTAKLSPQEQCATAFGFVTLKPPFCRSSL